MLYTKLVGEGGMQTVKALKESQGFNFESVDEMNVWDIGGCEALRKDWSKLYLKSVPFAGIIYVVNISEDMERLK